MLDIHHSFIEMAIVNVLKIIYLRAIGSGRTVHYQNLIVLIVPFSLINTGVSVATKNNKTMGNLIDL